MAASMKDSEVFPHFNVQHLVKRFPGPRLRGGMVATGTLVSKFNGLIICDALPVEVSRGIPSLPQCPYIT